MENLNITTILVWAILIFVGIPVGVWAVKLIAASFLMMNYSKIIKKDLTPLLTRGEKIKVMAIQHKSFLDFIHAAILVTNKRVIFYRRSAVLSQPSFSDIRLTDQLSVTYKETSSFFENLIGLGKATLTIQVPTRTESLDFLYVTDAQKIKQKIDDFKHS